MSETDLSLVNGHGPVSSSQRVVKPSAKKRRPPLACVQCYQRKLKCGKEFPSCGRCLKTGNAGQCTYRRSSTEYSSAHGALGDGHARGAGAMPTSLHTPVSLMETPEDSRISSNLDGKMTHLRGQEPITKFYGYSYPLNFYQQFTELRPYIARIKSEHTAINTLRDEIYPLTNDEYRLHPSIQDTVLTDTLRRLIPIKPVADTLVQTYLDKFEVTYRVLNKSAFMADYNQHWISPLSTPAPFLVQSLLVTAIAASFHPEICIDPTNQTTVHNQALDWIETAESWLDSSTNQRPQSWDNLATHCLLLIAKRAHYFQEGFFWTHTGALARSAMAAGYHRETGPTARISPYYREMRRRLWMTIVELDLQASVERGMPPSVRPEDFNIISPLNVDDDSLQQSNRDPLEGVTLAKLTDTSFQAIMYRSLNLRLRICALVNGCHDQEDFDQVLNFEEEFEKALQDIPEWNDPQGNPRQQQACSYVNKLLKIHIHQYKILLHIPFSIQTPPSFKSAICRRARTGILLASLNLCHEIYTNVGPCALKESTSITTFPQISAFMLTSVEQALQILERKVILTFHGLNEYYVLSMMIGLLKSKLFPESRATYDKEAGNRVVQLCKTLKNQQAVVQPHPGLPTEVDDERLRTVDHQDDGISVVRDSATELFSSMFQEDLWFANDGTDFAFFNV
ncbi:hypothetical protein MYU51_019431 [Penicillium brevicompactum]